MKKISKFIKNNYKFLIGVIVGLLLSGTGVYAANTIYSSNVTYDNSNSGLDATNVQDALDETYRKCFPIVINITLDNGSGTGGVPILLYLVYNDGVYLDSNFTKKLSTSGNNKITVPTRTGYTFDGYYTEENGNGIQLIDNEGYITNAFTNTYFEEDTTLYAKWIIITYTIKIFHSKDNEQPFLFETFTKKYGEPYVVAASTESGYHIARIVNENGEDIISGSTIYATSNMTYTMYFKKNGGGGGETIKPPIDE